MTVDLPRLLAALAAKLEAASKGCARMTGLELEMEDLFDELDRLRALCDEVSAQNAMVRHERDEARRERDAAETRSADLDGRLVEYGWRIERVAVCAYLRGDGRPLTADAIERGDHLPAKGAKP